MTKLSGPPRKGEEILQNKVLHFLQLSVSYASTRKRKEVLLLAAVHALPGQMLKIQKYF